MAIPRSSALLHLSGRWVALLETPLGKRSKGASDVPILISRHRGLVAYRPAASFLLPDRVSEIGERPGQDPFFVAGERCRLGRWLLLVLCLVMFGHGVQSSGTEIHAACSAPPRRSIDASCSFSTSPALTGAVASCQPVN